MTSAERIQAAYKVSQESFAQLGVDTDAALARLAKIRISLHCWQGDDVGGFENTGQRIGRRPGGDGQLSGQGADAGGIAGAIWRKLIAPAGQTSAQPPRLLRGDGRPTRRAQRIDAPAISRIGSIGPKRTSSAWISTRPILPIPRRPTASPWPIATRRCGNFGSSTASPAARSARPWAGRSARPASPTSGFRTVSRTRPWTAKGRANG